MANQQYTRPLPLSGNMAYQLFVGKHPFPLHQFLDDWREKVFEADAGYVVAVINAYSRMMAAHSGARDGTYRPK